MKQKANKIQTDNCRLGIFEIYGTLPSFCSCYGTILFFDISGLKVPVTQCNMCSFGNNVSNFPLNPSNVDTRQTEKYNV